MTAASPPASLYDALSEIHQRPAPFSTSTIRELWDDEHVSKQMLAFHLNPETEPASRPHAFIDRSAAWIARRFDLAAGRRVGDFGCGPGLYASRFARAGAQVTGVDFSRRSIRHAKNEAEVAGLPIDYVHADYLEYRSEQPFDLITLIFCDLCPLSPDRRHRLLTAFRDQLADGGSILLDVSSHESFAARKEGHRLEHRLMDGFWSPDDYWGFLVSHVYPEEAVTLDRYTIVEPDRTWRVDNWLQFFTLDSLRSELEACGLRICEHHADVAGSPAGEGDAVIAVVAEKA